MKDGTRECGWEPLPPDVAAALIPLDEAVAWLARYDPTLAGVAPSPRTVRGWAVSGRICERGEGRSRRKRRPVLLRTVMLSGRRLTHPEWLSAFVLCCVSRSLPCLPSSLLRAVSENDGRGRREEEDRSDEHEDEGDDNDGEGCRCGD